MTGAMLKAGQCWRYAANAAFEDSRIVIGAIATFSGGQRIICCSVANAAERQGDGTLAAVSIPFLAMTEAAFRATVTELAEDTEPCALADGFAAALADWQADPRGHTCFTVPFDGRMDHMIARQMAAIVGTDAA